MATPSVHDDPLPFLDVAGPDPTATVVARGVPPKNVCDTPGPIEYDCASLTGEFKVTVTTAGVSVAAVRPVVRSSVTVTPA